MTLPVNVTNLSGRTFGRLKVRSFSAVKGGYAYWFCDCECGTTGYEVRGKNLLAWEKAGRAISCGCYRSDSKVREAARLTMSAEDRRKAAAGGRVKPERTEPPKPKPPRVKKILPFLGDRERAAEVSLPAAGVAQKPDLNEAAAPTQSTTLQPPRQPERPALSSPARPALAVWVVITKERDYGYRVSLRINKRNTEAVMRGRKCASPSDARREAQRMFGSLQWQTREQAGLDGQPFVVEIAPISIQADKQVRQ